MEQTQQMKAPRGHEEARIQTLRDNDRAKDTPDYHILSGLQAALLSGVDLTLLEPQWLLELGQRAGNQIMLELLGQQPAPLTQVHFSLPETRSPFPCHPIQTWPPALTSAPNLTSWTPGTETAWDLTVPAQSPGQQFAVDWLD